MCVIIDANAISEVFPSRMFRGKDTRPAAGKQLYDWLNSKPGRLVIGGSKLQDELNNESYRTWILEPKRRGELRGKLRKYNDEEVKQKTQELLEQNSCQSDDEHIIALAQISNARLLYSKDKTLHKDFKNIKLLHDPGGKIFPRGNNRRDRRRRDNILSDESLCRQQ